MASTVRSQLSFATVICTHQRKKLDDMNGKYFDICRSVSRTQKKTRRIVVQPRTNRIALKMTSLRLRCIFTNIASNLLVPKTQPVTNFQRFRHIKEIATPKPANGYQYRRYYQRYFEVKRTIFDLNQLHLQEKDCNFHFCLYFQNGAFSRRQ